MKTLRILSILCLATGMIASCNPKDEAKPTDGEQATDQKASPDTAKNENSGEKSDDQKADDQKADDAKDNDAKPEKTKRTIDPNRVASESLIRLDKLYDYSNPNEETKECDEPEGCDCGTFKCPMNAVCHADSFCMCGKTRMPVNGDNELVQGYICTEIAKGVYDIACTERDGCDCGKIKVYSNMGCNGKNGTCAGAPVPGRGLSCSHKPYQKLLYSLNCFKDECDCYGETIHKGDICPPPQCERGYKPSIVGCACDGHKDDGKSLCVIAKDEKMVSYCISPDGCECGETTCPLGAVCRHKKCVDRASLKDIPEGFDMSMGIPKCVEEPCACGKKAKCQNGKFCLNGICYNDPYTRKLDGHKKALYYHIFDKEIADAGPKEKYRSDLWSLLFISSEYTQENTSNTAKRFICDLFDVVKVKGSDEDICKSQEHSDMLIGDIMYQCGTGEVPENVANMYCTLDVQDGALVFSGWEDE